MILTGQDSIRDVLLFPAMRRTSGSLEGDDAEESTEASTEQAAE